jgi:polysaccharide biosynthesis/export protein
MPSLAQMMMIPNNAKHIKLCFSQGLRAGVAAAVFSITVAGCALQGPAGDKRFAVAAQSEPPAPKAPYRIGSNDTLRIRVLGEPELSGDAFLVNQDGKVEMLLLGEIPAAGATTAELSEQLRGRLNDRFLVNPQVTVSVMTSTRQNVTVDGEVRKPGVVPYAGEMRLMQALAYAEGPTEIARIKDVIVIRDQLGQRLAARFDLKAIRAGEDDDPYLLPQDTVIVGQSSARILYRDLAKSLPSLSSMFVVISRD